MKCKYHKESEAKYICEKCKQPICEECAIDVKGNKICNTCVLDSMQPNRREVRRGGLLESFLFFCFASIPGAAHMYMNLFKRGFQLMITFIASMVVFSYANIESLIPLVMIPTWFFSFFDSYSIRKRLRSGEIIEDVEVYDYNIFIANRKYVGVAMVLIGLIGATNALGYSVFRSIFGMEEIYWAIKRSLIPLGLVVTGTYILLKSRHTKMESESTDNDIEA